MHTWSRNTFSSTGKLHIVSVSVQMGVIHDQEYSLDFGIYLCSNLPTLPMSTGSQMFTVDSWGRVGGSPPATGFVRFKQEKGKEEMWQVEDTWWWINQYGLDKEGEITDLHQIWEAWTKL